MTWFDGEPELADMLEDPMVQALMRADGWDIETLRKSFLPRDRRAPATLVPLQKRRAGERA